MLAIESSFKTWMQKPGIIKQLQLYLVLSILLNILLIQQIISLNFKQEINSKMQVKQEKPSLEKPEPTKLSEKDFENFTQEYLEKFFSTDQDSFDYLQSHTNTELYENIIKAELLNRQKQKIQSKFNLEDIYIEAINDKQIKATCIGREDFPAGDYMSRDFTIEFIIDAIDLEIVSIPVFKIN